MQIFLDMHAQAYMNILAVNVGKNERREKSKQRKLQKQKKEKSNILLNQNSVVFTMFSLSNDAIVFPDKR